jgi:hypothetical protein
MRISIDITGADERTLNDAAQRFNVPQTSSLPPR